MMSDDVKKMQEAGERRIMENIAKERREQRRYELAQVAMGALIAAPDRAEMMQFNDQHQDLAGRIITVSCRMADAMLAELEKKA